MKKLLSKIKWKVKGLKYSKYGPCHVFDIPLDDMKFKMSFGNYKLDPEIIARIEGRKEPETMALIKALVLPNMNVLEIGGCYGEFTLIMAECVKPNGKVVSIEGTPNNYDILKNNLDLNNVKNVEVHNIFITSRAEKAHFGANDDHPYNAIAVLDKEKPIPQTSIAVRAKILSQFLEEIKFVPDIIFMDIEGFELEVFKDFAKGYLKKNKPIIVFEAHPQYYKSSEDLKFILHALKVNGYFTRECAKNLICTPQKNS